MRLYRVVWSCFCIFYRACGGFRAAYLNSIPVVMISFMFCLMPKGWSEKNPLVSPKILAESHQRPDLPELESHSLNPKPQTRNPKPQTLNPKPQTPTPKS